MGDKRKGTVATLFTSIKRAIADYHSAIVYLQSCWFDIDSIRCPWSFPVDLMHVLYENIMPQLLALRQGTYKTQQTLGNAKAKHGDDFVLPKSVWTTMCREVELSNHTTPAQTAPSVGHLMTKTHWTAETHSYFLMFLGPILLRHRLPDRYYDHFISLSEIAKRLTMQEIETDQLPSLRRDIVRWVQGFERYVLGMQLR